MPDHPPSLPDRPTRYAPSQPHPNISPFTGAAQPTVRDKDPSYKPAYKPRTAVSKATDILYWQTYEILDLPVGSQLTFNAELPTLDYWIVAFTAIAGAQCRVYRRPSADGPSFRMGAGGHAKLPYCERLTVLNTGTVPLNGVVIAVQGYPDLDVSLGTI